MVSVSRRLKTRIREIPWVRDPHLQTGTPGASQWAFWAPSIRSCLILGDLVDASDTDKLNSGMLRPLYLWGYVTDTGAAEHLDNWDTTTIRSAGGWTQEVCFAVPHDQGSPARYLDEPGRHLTMRQHNVLLTALAKHPVTRIKHSQRDDVDRILPACTVELWRYLYGTRLLLVIDDQSMVAVEQWHYNERDDALRAAATWDPRTMAAPDGGTRVCDCPHEETMQARMFRVVV